MAPQSGLIKMDQVKGKNQTTLRTRRASVLSGVQSQMRMESLKFKIDNSGTHTMNQRTLSKWTGSRLWAEGRLKSGFKSGHGLFTRTQTWAGNFKVCPLIRNGTLRSIAKLKSGPCVRSVRKRSGTTNELSSSSASTSIIRPVRTSG